MSSQDNSFLQNFDESLDNLKKMVQNRADTSSEYNNMVISKIRSIDEKLSVLKQKAIEIASLVKQLKGITKDNKSELDQNRLQVKQLNDELARLEREKAELQEEIQNLTSKSGANIQEMQTQIDSKNVEVERLNKQIEEREKEMLNNQKMQGEEFSSKGQEQMQKHAQEIATLNAEIERLKSEIQQRENDMQKLMENVKNATDEHLRTIEELKTGSQGVNEQIQQLNERNNALVQKIIEATNIINIALKQMLELKDKNRTQNSSEIDAKIAETNALIQEIYDILNMSGDNPSPPSPSPPSPSPPSPSPPTQGEVFSPLIEQQSQQTQQRPVIRRSPSTYTRPWRGGKKTRKHRMKKGMRGGFIAIYDNSKSRAKTTKKRRISKSSSSKLSKTSKSSGNKSVVSKKRRHGKKSSSGRVSTFGI